VSVSCHGQFPTRSVRRGNALLAIAALCLSMPSAASGQWSFEGVERVVAISDVHGDYDAMRATLSSAGVLDENLEWSGATTHLVITGDLLDRGPDSRPVMDLIMRLESEALAAGGRVHQLLGNHEVMNLVGDLRYVSPGEYAAFAADETAAEREKWFAVFKDLQTETQPEAVLQQAFDDAAPPGFFAHRRAFRAEGVYGAWLLQKPLIVVIDGTAFVHGGVSPIVGELGLGGINERLARELRDYVVELAGLIDAGLLSPLDGFYDHDRILGSLPPDEEREAALQASIDSLTALNNSTIHAPDGPLWYRGNVGCGRLIESDRLNTALAALNASRVVIGHTPTLMRRILQRLDGRVIEIDTGMLNSFYQGSGNALIIADGRLSVINEGSAEVLSIAEHPRQVGRRDESLTAEDLQRILANGDIVSSITDENGVTSVKVWAMGHTVGAVFTKNPRSRGFVPEIAAYRLDRLLELGMVPVVVPRQIDGDNGTLQFAPQTMNEAERSAVGRGASAWCPIQDQWAAMYLFDALIFNTGRSTGHIRYSPDNWQLILTGHGNAFASRKGRPPHLVEIGLTLNDSWRSALAGLDDAEIEESFGDVLDKRRRKALRQRRDELLEY